MFIYPLNFDQSKTEMSISKHVLNTYSGDPEHFKHYTLITFKAMLESSRGGAKAVKKNGGQVMPFSEFELKE